MSRRSFVIPLALAATVIAPTLWLTGSSQAQPINRPAGEITPYDVRPVVAPALPVPPPPQPVMTRALLPGHWALDGARYVWIPPETRLRRVQSGEIVPGAYVWRNGGYFWVPAHYDN